MCAHIHDFTIPTVACEKVLTYFLLVFFNEYGRVRCQCQLHGNMGHDCHWSIRTQNALYVHKNHTHTQTHKHMYTRIPCAHTQLQSDSMFSRRPQTYDGHLSLLTGQVRQNRTFLAEFVYSAYQSRRIRIRCLPTRNAWERRLSLELRLNIIRFIYMKINVVHFAWPYVCDELVLWCMMLTNVACGPLYVV